MGVFFTKSIGFFSTCMLMLGVIGTWMDPTQYRIINKIFGVEMGGQSSKGMVGAWYGHGMGQCFMLEVSQTTHGIVLSKFWPILSTQQGCDKMEIIYKNCKMYIQKYMVMTARNPTGTPKQPPSNPPPIKKIFFRMKNKPVHCSIWPSKHCGWFVN